MLEVEPRICLTDVLLHIDTHPSARTGQLMPGWWKTPFAGNPIAFTIAAVAMGAVT